MKTNRDHEYSVAHTRERLRERYGIEATDEDYRTMCVMAKIGRIVSEEPDMNQLVVEIVFHGQRVQVVWDTANERIRTALPQE